MQAHEIFTLAMEEVNLKQCDIARLTGKDRRTVWRWQTGKTPIPDYAWTIIRLQKKVLALTTQLCTLA